jgi:hypothetical protein
MPTVAGRVLRGSVIDITERRQAEQALAYRDRIVHAMSLSVADLVAAPSLAAGMQRALQTAAEALKVDRILILERTPVAEPETAVSMAHAWMTANAPKLDAKSFSEVFPDSPELADWLAPLLQGKPVVTKAATAPGIIGRIMRQMHNISTLMVPISVAGRYWGHIRLDDCRVEREWTPVEHNMLGTFSQAIGALIMRTGASLSTEQRGAFPRRKRHRAGRNHHCRLRSQSHLLEPFSPRHLWLQRQRGDRQERTRLARAASLSRRCNGGSAHVRHDWWRQIRRQDPGTCGHTQRRCRVSH